MVKAKKGNTLIFGLSDMNLERLKKGEPISFNLNELGAEPYDILIFHGKDEQAMYQSMKSQIHPFKTIIKDDNAKNN